MSEQWPTQADDMAAADKIIEKYIDLNDGEPVGLLEMVFEQQQLSEVMLPDWLVEVSEYFTQLYGPEQGNRVTNFVVSRCMVGDAIIH